MKGYKAFDKNLKCRGFQYEIGKSYKMEDFPVCCEKGFHFCKNIADVYNYYPKSDDTRICEIEAFGDVVHENNKSCTNAIRIVREITEKSEKHCNSDGSEVGYCNTGYCNTGNRNTGDWNTGNRNTGDWNTGDWNTGYSNTGDWNTGNRNTGNRNTGDWNTGNRNTGDWNTGYSNTGYSNTGYSNTGNSNTGDSNTGNRNTGDWNTGYSNTGDWNTGDWNTTNHSAGCFCTKESKIKMFNKDSSMTYRDWFNSRARAILYDKPSLVVEWIYSSDMTDEEKKENPTHETTGGYLKVHDETESSQKWWDNLPEDDKKCVIDLPNFDSDIFYECTGIRVEVDK